MLSNLSPYLEPMMAAAFVFPALVFLITIPYMVHCYRRFGGINVLRMVFVYTFLFYLLCAYLLTVLPLPSPEKVQNMRHIRFNWIPFSNFYDGITTYGFDPAHPVSILNIRLWRGYLPSGMFFQILANIIMLVPLGSYLRYFFRCDRKKTIFIAFCVSLFFELTQWSGLYFIYSQPYRVPDINDLMANTFGGFLGYELAGWFVRFLPSRDELDRVSESAGKRAGIFQRLVAAACDWAILMIVQGLLVSAYESLCGEKMTTPIAPALMTMLFLLYFVVLQRALRGRTPGKLLVRIESKSTTAKPTPDGFDYCKKYLALYVGAPFLLTFNMLLLFAAVCAFLYETPGLLRVLAVMAVTFVWTGSFGLILFTQKKEQLMPWDAFGHIRVEKKQKRSPNAHTAVF